MRGSTKIVLGALLLMFLLSAISSAKEDYAFPVVQIVKIGHTVVRFDGIAYHFRSPTPISVTFETIDDTHVELDIKTVEVYVPTTTISLWWEDFPINSLDISSGGDNSWTLDTETGYAEK